MLNRIKDLLKSSETFAFETTLATKIYRSKIIEAQEKGYTVTLLFFWLENIELAKERVATRVKEGGHFIADDIIERRYLRGIKNLFEIYLDFVNGALIFINSLPNPKLLAEKSKGENIIISNEIEFNFLKQ